MLSRYLSSRLLARMTSGNPSTRRIPLATRFGIVGFVAGSVYFMHWYDEELKKEKLKQEREQNLWNNTQQYNIGRNDWTLVDCKNNSVVTKDKLKDKWLLMYFGFAHCPDICPETMEKIMDIKEIHDHARTKNPELPDLEPVFVTIDPERDTPENLAYYLEDYPAFLGLTGSSQQIKQMCKNYKIYFSVGPKKRRRRVSFGPHDRHLPDKSEWRLSKPLYEPPNAARRNASGYFATNRSVQQI